MYRGECLKLKYEILEQCCLKINKNIPILIIELLDQTSRERWQMFDFNTCKDHIRLEF